MDRNLMQRGGMAALGACAGLSLYALSELIQSNVVPDRVALGLASFGAVFFFAALALTGPLRLVRAALGALGVAGVVALLMIWASLRFETVEAFLDEPLAVLMAMILATVPLPFLIAANGPGWRDYPTLFNESWGIVVRYAAAWVFTGVVWGVIFLSDALLSIVGLTVIRDMLNIEVVPWLVVGAVLGLSLAVVMEMADLLSPYLVLRLMRLLLPVVMLVMAVFVLALPVQGLAGLFGGLSVAATLLTMLVAATTLVTIAVDQSDDDAVQGPWMVRMAQALALLVPVYAVLAGYALWVRVDQYGWTPARLFVAVAVALALGYGAVYVWALLGRAGWLARLRAGNRGMALVVLAVAAAWLSVFDAQSISARDQLARFEDGRTRVSDLDLHAFDDWGLAGVSARAVLNARAAEPGQEALAERLEATASATVPVADQRMRLRAQIPVRPQGEQALADALIADLPDWQLEQVRDACSITLDDDIRGCLLIVGDFWTDMPGPEAMLLFTTSWGELGRYGYVQKNGDWVSNRVTHLTNDQTEIADIPGLLRKLQRDPVAIRAVPQNMLDIGDGTGLIILP